MQLTDICPLSRWVAFEKHMHERFGIDINVFNPEGIRITDHKAWVNRLCPAIKATDKGQAFICAVAHMNISGEARRTQQSVIEECDAGLIKLVVPIFFQGEYLGAVGACGLRFEDGEVDPFLVHKVAGIPEETVEELAVDIGVMPREKAFELARTIESEIQHLIEACGSSSGQATTSGENHP
uniref:PocR domain-containing protein n=1 Tax=Desulfatirhabdium butyrativorans TaxID=340467 RepID=A0A7C4RUM0_9BACT